MDPNIILSGKPIMIADWTALDQNGSRCFCIFLKINERVVKN